MPNYSPQTGVARTRSQAGFVLKFCDMTRGTPGVALNVCAALALSVAAVAKAQGPPSPADGVVLAEQYFKNIQSLKGIPVDEFMDTMGMFAAATGMNCVDCHVSDAGGDWAKYADDTAFKRTTRRMVAMVNTLNEGSFGGRKMVTCFTCHRGLKVPATLPDLDLQYGEPPPVDPDQIKRSTPGAPTPDQILDKYCLLYTSPSPRD